MRTLPELLGARVASSGPELAWRGRAGDTWVDWSWGQADAVAHELAAGLLATGLRPGDRVAIAGRTRVEWMLAAWATWRAGGVVVTVYPTVPADEAAYVVRDAGASWAFVEDAGQRDKLTPVLPADRIVGFEAHLGLGALRSAGLALLAERPGAVDEATRSVGADDLAALVYTSGTTGRPKGVMLRHVGFVAVCQAVSRHTPLEPGDLQYLFLPLAHVYGLVVALAAAHVGVPSAVDGDVDRIGEGLATTRPTFLPAVPRVFEKVVERAEGRARARSVIAHRIFLWALATGRAWSEATREGRPVPRSLAVQHALADRLVYRKVRDALGGRLRAVASGGAPLAPEIGAFLHAAGIPVLEGYGLTETTAIATASRLDGWRLGAVGLPEAGVDLRIADDGEVLIRGPNVFAGYWNLPDATAEAFTDGWFHTGDLGHVDDDGFLHITGRKKDLIVTAGGKNIAPAKIENRLKAASPLIGDALVHGDRRPCCTALVALDEDALAAWATSRGLKGSYASLVRQPEVLRAVREVVAQVNATLPPYETIKDVHLLDHPPTVANGELTPSLKLKRRVLEARYAAALDALYGHARS